MNDTFHPVAIGGLGGSGTRMFARLLQLNGYYLGGDLNEAIDNLWFTLLFKRRSALLMQTEDFNDLMDIFISVMSGDGCTSIIGSAEKYMSAVQDRLFHDGDWLGHRLVSLISAAQTRRNSCAWGWKEPNTHIFIEKFLARNKNIKYIHVLRNPYYMVGSKNQNQLMNWGGMFFDMDIEISERNSLAFWVKTHQRIIRLQKTYPHRIKIMWYEDLVDDPYHSVADFNEFIELPVTSKLLDQFCSEVDTNGGVIESKESIGSEFFHEDVYYSQKIWLDRTHRML